VGPTTAQVVPISPATQSEVELTMRTAPVVVLTQAEIMVETGAAIAAVLANKLKPNTPRYLAENIETSGGAAVMRSGCVM
jgi:hypothetical protein